MKVAVFAVTAGGSSLAVRIAAGLGDGISIHHKASIASMQKAFPECDAMVCIMSAGIAVRAIGPLCRDKYSDPCVVVVDEEGRHAISLLSGHLGGGNALARRIALITGGDAVITTASDILGKTAIDLWAEKNSLSIRSERIWMTRIAAKLVNTGKITVFSEHEIGGLPGDCIPTPIPETADIIITCRASMPHAALYLTPCHLAVGIGCNRGTSAEEIQEAMVQTCLLYDIHPAAVSGLASIDAKIDENGLLDFAAMKKLPLHFFSKEQLNEVAGLGESPYAIAAVGAKGVAEPAAILAASNGTEPGKLIVAKKKWKNVTTAVAARKIQCLDV